MFAYIYIPQTKKYRTVCTTDIYQFNIDNYDSKIDTYNKHIDKLILPDGKKQTCQVLKLGGKNIYIYSIESNIVYLKLISNFVYSHFHFIDTEAALKRKLKLKKSPSPKIKYIYSS